MDPISIFFIVVLIVAVAYLYYMQFFTKATTTTTPTTGGTTTPSGSGITYTTLASTITPLNTTVTSVAKPTYQEVADYGTRRDYIIAMSVVPKAANVNAVITIAPGNGFVYTNMVKYTLNIASADDTTGLFTNNAYTANITPITGKTDQFTLTFLSNSIKAHNVVITMFCTE